MLKLELTDEMRRVLVRAIHEQYDAIEGFLNEGCSLDEEEAAIVEMNHLDDLLDMIDSDDLWEEEKKPHLTLINGGKS